MDIKQEPNNFDDIEMIEQRYFTEKNNPNVYCLEVYKNKEQLEVLDITSEASNSLLNASNDNISMTCYSIKEVEWVCIDQDLYNVFILYGCHSLDELKAYTHDISIAGQEDIDLFIESLNNK
ncbi:TPA: hypothetical protein PEV23_002418 [Staphylococcus aureus]|nr:hypothetical protein [Staphylococcus aureus]HDA0159105.1 hypothetical protein [Staphylococcus aureus]HDE3815882.1 hypothetical protein [Staphylococcus aureus]HDF6783475.1 hypothetical protein [Staphylococcus aureus]